MFYHPRFIIHQVKRKSLFINNIFYYSVQAKKVHINIIINEN